jgi:hypothetical protein
VGKQYFFQPRGSFCPNRSKLAPSMYCKDCPDGYVDKGEWVAGATYDPCDLVTALGVPWIYQSDSAVGTIDNAPGVSGEWQRVFTLPYALMDFSQATIEPVAPNPNGVTTEFLRASEATVVDYKGRVVTVPANTPRFQGARSVWNIINLQANPGGSGGISWVDNGDIWTVTLNFEQQVRFAPIGGPAAQYDYEKVGRITLRVISGTTDEIQVDLGDTAVGARTYSIADLSDWKTVSVFGNKAISFIDVKGTNSTDLVLEIKKEIQVERAYDGIDSIPSEFVDGAKSFPYTNGNTVDANGFVTEAQGAPIKGITYLNEPAATNLVPSSEDASSWESWNTSGDTEIASITEAFGVKIFEIKRLTSEIFSGVLATSTLSLVTGEKVFISFIAKAGATDSVRIWVRNVSVNISSTLQVSLLTGEVNDVSNQIGDMALENSKYLGDGYWKFEMSIVPDQDITAHVRFNPRPEVDDNSLPASCFVGAVQVEKGECVTSYIPTNGAEVTREADDLRYIGCPTADISMQIGWQHDVNASQEGNWRLCGSKDGRGPSYEFRTWGTNNWGMAARPGLVSQNMATMNGGELELPGKYVFAGGYKDGDQKAYLGGALKASEANVITFDHSNQYFQVGRWDTEPTTIPLRFSTFKLWDVALPDDELKALSSLDYNC